MRKLLNLLVNVDKTFKQGKKIVSFYSFLTNFSLTTFVPLKWVLCLQNGGCNERINS